MLGDPSLKAALILHSQCSYGVTSSHKLTNNCSLISPSQRFLCSCSLAPGYSNCLGYICYWPLSQCPDVVPLPVLRFLFFLFLSSFGQLQSLSLPSLSPSSVNPSRPGEAKRVCPYRIGAATEASSG